MATNELDRDLDIFGDSGETGNSDIGVDNIFGWDDSADDSADTWTDMFNEEEGTEGTETSNEESSESADTQNSENESGTEGTDADAATGSDTSSEVNEDDAALDEEMQRLFKELEDEAGSENPDQNVMDDILNEMRIKSAQDETEKAFLRKQNETLQNRLLEYASKDVDQGVNQPLISKVDSDPKLRALIHLTGNQDEAAKQKLARILGDMYSEVTWVDIASIMEESQNSKMSAVLGGGSRGGSEISATRDDSNPTSYDDSISKLW